MRIQIKKSAAIILCVTLFMALSITANASTGGTVCLFELHDKDKADRYSWIGTTASQYKLRDSNVVVVKFDYFSKSVLYNGLKKANLLSKVFKRRTKVKNTKILQALTLVFFNNYISKFIC